MKYLTGIHSLNLPCKSLGTPGDWHATALRWVKLTLRESEDSVFGDFGIDGQAVVDGEGYICANHLRACLDLIEEHSFPAVQGMREYFLSDETLTPVVFEKVMLLKKDPQWDTITDFMGKEYGRDWFIYLEGNDDA